MKVGVIGAGAWGSALAVVAGRAGNDVILWAYDADVAKDMQENRTSPLISGVIIPDNILITADMAGMRDTDVWLIVTPADYFSETAQNAKAFYNGQPVIICTKGMSADGKFMSEIATEVLTDKIGVLSGPQFAGEVAQGKPTGSTIAGSKSVIDAARIALSGLVLEETDDIAGVQICGTGKNAIAILMGYLDGQGKSENERALKLTQSFGEIVALGRAMGARTETFLGLAGLGDLFLTATSKTSRNYAAGYALALGKEIIGTVEGFSAIRGLSKLTEKAGISTPNLEFLSGLV